MAACMVAAILFVPSGPFAQAATLSVNCGTGGDLQAKIDAAASGSTILVKGTCFGNFQILGKGLTLKGNPTATLDGNDLGRTLFVSAAGKAVHLVGLTVTGGESGQGGAGIISTAAALTLNKVKVTGNLGAATSSAAQGGGIFSGAGNVTLTDSTVGANRAIATEAASAGTGGGLYVQNGDLTIKNSLISGNRATAHPSSGVGTAMGGGFYLDNGNLTVQGSTISGNRVTASAPGNSEAFGAAGFDSSGSKAVLTGAVITGNIATATSTSGSVLAGRTLALFATSESISGSRIEVNRATGEAPDDAAQVNGLGVYGSNVHVTASSISSNFGTATGHTASAQGGGVNGNTVVLTRSTVDGNHLTVTGGFGSSASGGGVNVDFGKLTATATTISRNTVTAHTSSTVASSGARGGGVSSTSEIDLTNSTIAFNNATATAPASGGTATAAGGGLGASIGSLVDSTVAGNTTSATSDFSTRQGGGLNVAPNVTLKGTIVANNTAVIGPDCAGGPASDGHNLIRKTVGCSFTKKPTDLVAKNPLLGPLAANGGPTQTMAIALASPTRDAILAAACAVATDQRGVHRPQGPRCDIGAYERKLP
jgi:hypothetical protein